MTETPIDDAVPPPPPPAPTPPLFRPKDGRMFRGVCAAAARATGTDPVLWRVVVAVLALFGGSGLVLYLAGWLLLPEEGAQESDAQRLGRGQGVSSGAVLALVALAVLTVFVVLDDGRGLVPLAVVGVLGWLVLRSRAAAAPGGWPPVAPVAGTGARAGAGVGWGAPPAWAGPGAAGPAAPTWGPPPEAYGPPPPRPPKLPRSPLAALTLSAVALVVGALLLGGALGLDGVSAERVLSAALLVTGAGLVVGARWGRARGLIALAVVLALALSAVSGVDRRYDTSAGERTWLVEGPVEHSVGAGSAVLDLRPLAGTERRDLDVQARVGVGELLVLVPEDLRVDVDANVGLGELSLDNDVNQVEGGPGLARQSTLGPVGPRNVRLDVRVGLGELEVRRVEQ